MKRSTSITAKDVADLARLHTAALRKAIRRCIKAERGCQKLDKREGGHCLGELHEAKVQAFECVLDIIAGKIVGSELDRPLPDLE